MIIDVLLAVSLSAAQLPPPPPPPPPPPGPAVSRDRADDRKGTATIKGRVFMPDGRPLRRAEVAATGGELTDGRRTTTGLEGEYVLEELPAGRYTLTVSRSGYLPTRYGQTRYGEPGSPFEIKEGEAIDNVNFTLDRAGVISGRVLDESGEPAAGVQVWAMQPQFFRGSRRLVPIGTRVMTDDAGNYRLLALPPGEYVVVGILRDTWMSDEKEPRMLAYAPTYYPGSATATDAQRVKVAAGQEAAAIDFALSAMRAATLSGTAIGSDGAPLAGGSVSLTLEMAGPSFVSMSMIGNARVGPDGTWTLKDVAPGEYTLRASGTVGDRGGETALLKVVVHGTDLVGLALTTDPGVLLSGRVSTDTGERLPAGQLTVSTGLVTMENPQVRGTPGKDDGVVAADGTFLRKSPSGAVVIRVSGLPRGWGLKSVLLGGRDYVGAPIEVRPGQPVSGIRAIVSQRFPTLRGRVTNDQNAPAEGVAIIFPTDPARWIEAGAMTRLTKADRNGAFQIDTVRPGDYYLVAVEYLQQWQANDPEFLEALRPRATKVSVGEQPVNVELRVVR